MGMRRGPRSGTRLNRAPEERKKIGRLAFIFDLSGDFVLKLDLHLGWTLTSTGAGSKIAQQGRLGRRKSRRTLSEYDHAGRAGRQAPPGPPESIGDQDGHRRRRPGPGPCGTSEAPRPGAHDDEARGPSTRGFSVIVPGGRRLKGPERFAMHQR